jgi:hypothetical protein
MNCISHTIQSNLRSSASLRTVLLVCKQDKSLRTAPFWAIVTTTTRWLIAFFDSWNLNMGPIGCPETSVRNTTTRCVIAFFDSWPMNVGPATSVGNYQHTIRNDPKGRSSHILDVEARIQDKCYFKKAGNLLFLTLFAGVGSPTYFFCTNSSITHTDGSTSYLLIQ